jgi:hypothetical protein
MRTRINKINLEDGFIGRVYRTSAIVYAISSLYVWAYAGVASFLGLTAGVAMALLSLRSIEWSAKRFLASLGDGETGRRTSRLVPWWGIALGKYLIFALLVAGIVRASEARSLNLIAFLGGFALVHAVIVLKAVGAAALGSWLLAPGGDAGSTASRLRPASNQEPRAKSQGLPDAGGQHAR